jgi:hypothetical protein
MSRSLARRGASVLVAAAVLGGGLALGGGTASAVCQSSGDLSRLRSIAEPLGIESIAYCPGATMTVKGSVENVNVAREVRLEVGPGSSVVFQNKFDLSADPDRNLTKVVDHPPRGFEMAGVEVVLVEWIDGVQRRTPLEADHIAQDPATGAVTIAPPGEGWSIPRRAAIGFSHVAVGVTYRVPLFVKNGDVLPSGVTFEATGLTGPNGWSRMDGSNTVVNNPYLEAFGSSGS